MCCSVFSALLYIFVVQVLHHYMAILHHCSWCNLLSIFLQCFVVYFHRCHASTLKVCRAAVNEWEDHVAAMATDCPTFSRGVQHIFAALKEDCDGYEERLRHLEEVWGEGGEGGV